MLIYSAVCKYSFLHFYQYSVSYNVEVASVAGGRFVQGGKGTLCLPSNIGEIFLGK